MAKSRVLGLMGAGFVECLVFVVVLAFDGIDEKINQIDGKLCSKRQRGAAGEIRLDEALKYVS
jgi:hypothetical protein